MENQDTSVEKVIDLLTSGCKTNIDLGFELDIEIIKANRFVLINHTNKNLEPQFVKNFDYSAAKDTLKVTHQVTTEQGLNNITPKIGDKHKLELYYTNAEGKVILNTKKVFIADVVDYELRGDYESDEFDTSILTITFFATEKL